MKNIELQRRFRIWLGLIMAGALFGPPINYFTVSQDANSLLRGFIDGVIIGALVGGYTLFVRDRWLRAFFHRMNFSLTVLVNGFMYLILFHAGRFLSTSLHSEGGYGGLSEFLLDRQMLIVVPVFYVIAITIEFILQMNLLIGHNVLRYFLMGTYHQPREEERIFMFLDLQGSTAMAEQMGSAKYYALLEQFVNALTEPVLRSQGEIMGYVGDEVIITWRKEVGLRDGNCIQCFFRIDDVLERSKDTFMEQFGREPRYRAGMHGGEVIAGELGDIKREIVFVGDVMNTAARLEEYAKKNEKRLIVSGAIIDDIHLPEGIEATYLSEHQPRGKEESIRLYEVQRAG